MRNTIINNYYKDVEGWFSSSDKEIYDMAVDKYEDGSIFVEVGSFKGRSSVAMAVNILNSNKNIKFYCIDTWKGSEEHQAGQSFEDKDVVNGVLYETFIKNIEPVKNIITPIRKASLDAINDFDDRSITFLFLDAAHDYDNVKKDLNAWKSKVKSGGLLAGHDWSWESVRKAITEFCDENSLEVKPYSNTWSIQI